MNNIDNQLSSIEEEVKKSINEETFEKYFLELLFYKHFSEKVDKFANEKLKEAGEEKVYSELEEVDSRLSDLMNDQKENLGYSIKPKYLFSKFICKIKEEEKIIKELSGALSEFGTLFTNIDLTSNLLGLDNKTRNNSITTIIKSVNEFYDNLTSELSTDSIFNYFALNGNRNNAFLYTPEQVSELISQLVKSNKKPNGKIYDPACGTASLLSKAAKATGCTEIYGQDVNLDACNHAKMNLLARESGYKHIEIKQGETLTDDKFQEFVDEKGFDVIVSNPPFGFKWDSSSIDIDKDKRFKRYGKLAPKSRADFAFLQHMVSHLDKNGIMVSVVSNGVLFRGAAEGNIREYMIEEENVVDAVISLPAKLLYGTSIPISIVVFRKNRGKDDDVLFIDASKGFKKQKNINFLQEKDITKIVNTFNGRITEGKYSYLASIEEIRANDYNLNIQKYVTGYEDIPPVDVNEIYLKLKENKEKQQNLESQIKTALSELGINSIEDLKASTSKGR